MSGVSTRERHDVFVSLPSARGVHPSTVWALFDMRTELEKVGSYLHGSSIYRLPVDLARNEGVTIFLSTTADMNLLLDDDVQIAAEWLPKMVEALCNGCDIITVPCKMRSEGNLYNIIPLTDPLAVGGLRVVECAWTGLGCVLVARRVIEKLFELEPEKYRSTHMPPRMSAAIFKSQVVSAQKFFVERAVGAEEEYVYVMDDRVFSLKAIAAGFKIHAAIDVPATHDGISGCFSEDLERLAHMQRSRHEGLIGPDGRKLSKEDR